MEIRYPKEKNIQFYGIPLYLYRVLILGTFLSENTSTKTITYAMHPESFQTWFGHIIAEICWLWCTFHFGMAFYHKTEKL